MNPNAPPNDRSNAAREIAISARGIVVAFGEKRILDGLDLDIRRGEVLVLKLPVTRSGVLRAHELRSGGLRLRRG